MRMYNIIVSCYICYIDKKTKKRTSKPKVASDELSNNNEIAATSLEGTCIRNSKFPIHKIQKFYELHRIQHLEKLGMELSLTANSF